MTADVGSRSADVELTPADVEAYTDGRLSASDPETQRYLDSAHIAARRYCGWHVSPTQLGDVITLDGPGGCYGYGGYYGGWYGGWYAGWYGYGRGRTLPLPTQQLVNLTSIIEDGNPVDLTQVQVSTNSTNQQILVRKTNGDVWTANYSGIVVTMDHCYSADNAANWRQAILQMVDQMATGGRPDSQLLVKRVDDVSYTWDKPLTADQAVLTVMSTLDDYKLTMYEVYFA